MPSLQRGAGHELPGTPLKEGKPVHANMALPAAPSPAPWEHGQYAAGSAGSLDPNSLVCLAMRFPTFETLQIMIYFERI